MTPRFSLGSVDWRKILTGFGLALAGAVLTWAAAEAIPALKESDDPALLLTAAILSAVINVLRKWLTDTRGIQ